MSPPLQSLRCARRILGRLVWPVLMFLWVTPALAQTRYTNTTDGAFDENSAPCSAPLVRNFTVAAGTVSDLNIGILLSHTWRGDLEMVLQSPSGTRVVLFNQGGGSADNFNVLLDSANGTAIVDHTADDTATAGTTVPPYQRTGVYRPDESLNAFNGQSAGGTWRLKICDGAGGDAGTFYQADLYVTTGAVTTADLSLAKSVSFASPLPGVQVSYTLTVASAVSSGGTATGVQVRDTLPASFLYRSSSGNGTYDSATGIWTVGSLAPGASATITIVGANNSVSGTLVANTAEITASSLPDPDSTVNNGVTSEDDYAAVSFTISGTFNCPVGSTATGSGFASSGTGANLGRIFWLDWSCGGSTSFPTGSTINKTWNAGDGLVLTGQITALTKAVQTYTVGTWGGDMLDELYAGVNPIGLRNAIDGEDPQFSFTLSATLNGLPVTLRYVLADAEDGGGSAAAESVAATTNGSAWTLLESAGSIAVNNTGSSVTIYDPAAAGGGTAIVETSASSLSLAVTMMGGGGTAAAFGFYTPYDYSDGPISGASYGAANHRTISTFRMGSTITAEATAYDSPNASADGGDDGVTLPELVRGQAVAVPVTVSGGGYLNGWIDFNDDGDFADAGEQVATNALDGGAGDNDGAVNGIIQLSVTPPAGAATTPTIARFRYASISGASISGLYGYGEVEDYGLSVLSPGLSVIKLSAVLSDPVNGTGAGRMAIPGAVVEYCIQISNTGTATATSIAATDTLPPTTSYVTGSLTSGNSCAAATNPEDDNAVDADESDPIGASISGSALSITAGSLAASSELAAKFRVTVN